MAKKGGARPGAGRPRGSVSSRAVDVLTGAVAEGLLPLEYLLGIMRDDKAEKKDRDWAADKAAPYIHPRPAPYARPVTIGLPDTSTADGVKTAIATVIKAAGEGTIAPSEAQSLVAVIEAQRKAIETADLVERIERLEQEARRNAN